MNWLQRQMLRLHDGFFGESSDTHDIKGLVRSVDGIQDVASFLRGLPDVLPAGGFFEFEGYLDEQDLAAFGKLGPVNQHVWRKGWGGRPWRTVWLPLDQVSANWLSDLQADYESERTDVDLGVHRHARNQSEY